MSSMAQLRSRLDTLRAQQASGADVRQAARALRQELEAVPAPELENPGALRKKADVVRTRLRMARPECPADAPPSVLEVAASLEGEILSEALLDRVAARLRDIASPAEAHRTVAATLRADVARREARVRTLAHYLELLDILTDSRSP